MCDYSLYSVQNRLAQEGDELFLHKFETGTRGFVDANDLLKMTPGTGAKAQAWSARIKSWFRPSPSRLPAICIPPGARLLLTDIPERVQKALHVGPEELTVFTELSDRTYSYRDALLLPNGARVRLQDLPEGIRAVVWSLSSEGSSEPSGAELHAINR